MSNCFYELINRSNEISIHSNKLMKKEIRSDELVNRSNQIEICLGELMIYSDKLAVY